MPTLNDKLQSYNGLCTSIVASGRENAQRMNAIVEAFLGGHILQRAHRASNDWEDVCELPMNFEDFRYRCTTSPVVQWEMRLAQRIAESA